jgi:hypothetical protein
VDRSLWKRFAVDAAAEGAPPDETSARFPRYIIHPHSPWKLAWDVFIMSMVLYTILGLPYQVSVIYVRI